MKPFLSLNGSVHLSVHCSPYSGPLNGGTKGELQTERDRESQVEGIAAVGKYHKETAMPKCEHPWNKDWNGELVTNGLFKKEANKQNQQNNKHPALQLQTRDWTAI